MNCLLRYNTMNPVICVGLLTLFLSSDAHALSPNLMTQPKNINVAFLPTVHIPNSIQPEFQLENAQVIGQDETGFFLEEMKEMGQLCDLKIVSCLSSVGQLLDADLIIQIWTDPEKNDVFRFIDIGLEQEIHRQMISKKMTNEKLMRLIENTFAALYDRPVTSSGAQKIKNNGGIEKSATLSQHINSDPLPLKRVSGWSAIGVGSLSTLVGSLFYFAHPAHTLIIPAGASHAQQTHLENEQQEKKNIAYTMWTSGTVLAVAGLLQLFQDDVKE